MLNELEKLLKEKRVGRKTINNCLKDTIGEGILQKIVDMEPEDIFEVYAAN